MCLLCVMCFIRRQAACQEETTHEDLRRQTTFLGNIAFAKTRLQSLAALAKKETGKKGLLHPLNEFLQQPRRESRLLK